MFRVEKLISVCVWYLSMEMDIRISDWVLFLMESVEDTIPPCPPPKKSLLESTDSVFSVCAEGKSVMFSGFQVG